MPRGNLHRGEEDEQRVRRDRNICHQIEHQFLFAEQALRPFPQAQYRETHDQVRYLQWGANRGNERWQALQFPLHFLQRCRQ